MNKITGIMEESIPAIPDLQRAWGLSPPPLHGQLGKALKDTLFCCDRFPWPMQQSPSGLFNNAVIKVLFCLYFGAWAYNFTFLIINLSPSSGLEFLFICALNFSSYQTENTMLCIIIFLLNFMTVLHMLYVLLYKMSISTCRFWNNSY